MCQGTEVGRNRDEVTEAIRGCIMLDLLDHVKNFHLYLKSIGNTWAFKVVYIRNSCVRVITVGEVNGLRDIW